MRVATLAIGLLAAMSAVGVVFALAGCDGAATLADINVEANDSDEFDPVTVNVEPGQRVIWTNTDSDAHTVTVDPLNPAPGGPNSGDIAPGGTFTWTVPGGIVPGTRWFYHCEHHGTPGDGTGLGVGMVGVMVAF
jgi:plastocyanin